MRVSFSHAATSAMSGFTQIYLFTSFQVVLYTTPFIRAEDFFQDSCPLWWRQSPLDTSNFSHSNKITDNILYVYHLLEELGSWLIQTTWHQIDSLFGKGYNSPERGSWDVSVAEEQCILFPLKARVAGWSRGWTVTGGFSGPMGVFRRLTLPGIEVSLAWALSPDTAALFILAWSGSDGRESGA